MGVNTKAIQTRIKSVKNTKKITKAMEMISAVKMRKAVANVLATRDYSDLSWQMLKDISEKIDIKLHPLLTKKEKTEKLAVILITGNRGLAGGFISKMLAETDKYIKKQKEQNPDLQVDIILTGKKGQKIYSYYKHNIAAVFEKHDLTTKVEEITAISKMITDEFVSEKYDKVALAYTDFESAIAQTPRIKELLPFSTQEDDELGKAEEHKRETQVGRHELETEFKFEPDPKQVLDVLLPRLVETQIYQAVLESDASEHSARMVAMKNAGDAAADMIEELNYNFNKARQSAITQEISEIVGGAAALE